MSRASAAAWEPFGDQTPGCEPYWYQGFPSPYYGRSHIDFRNKCRTFTEAEIRPHLETWIQKQQVYPLELHSKALAAGLPTAGLAKDVQSMYPEQIIPEGGFDSFHELIYLDETANVGPGGAMFQAGINSMALPPILFAGSKMVQNMVVPGVIAGQKNISLAISEPTAGSDVANLRLTAVREGNHYIVNGQKKWITGGNVADFFTLVARTGGPGPAGLSLLLVDAKSPGIDVRKMETQFDSTLGTTFITFDNVTVPVEHLIGEEEALKYAIRRKTFGKSLVEHQMIRWKIAEMARQIEALHDSNERVAFQYKAGVPDAKLGSQCALLKVQASKTLEFCAREASQVFGGSALVREGSGKLVERIYREVRAQAIPGGSEEILLDLASRQAINGAMAVMQAKSKL